MQAAALILGIFGSLTGTISLVIKLIEFYNDRARLVTEVSLFTQSSIKLPVSHFVLEIIFMNRGRRPITIIEGEIDLPVRDFFIDGKPFKAESVKRPLFKAGTHAGLTIDSHQRKEIVFDPFDAFNLKECIGNAKAYFTDAIGNRYPVEFIVPPADQIIKVSTEWNAFRQKHQGDLTDPAKHAK